MYPLIGLSLVLLTVLLFAGFGLVRSASAAEPAASAPAAPSVTAAAVKGLDKAELQRMLKHIERASEPKPKMGAMCYDMAAPAATANYICPTCHAKTLYALGTNGVNSAQVWLVTYDVETARRLVGQIRAKDPGVHLIETALCRHCSPDVKEPSLALRLTFADGTSRDVSPVTGQDLQLLCDFLAGRKDSDTFNDGTIAIKPALPRIRELLGFTPPATNAPALKQ